MRATATQQLIALERFMPRIPGVKREEVDGAVERAFQGQEKKWGDALEYADSMTITGREVPDELFEKVRRFYDDDALVELTATIAWENSSSKFNRALRV